MPDFLLNKSLTNPTQILYRGLYSPRQFFFDLRQALLEKEPRVVLYTLPRLITSFDYFEIIEIIKRYNLPTSHLTLARKTDNLSPAQ